MQPIIPDDVEKLIKEARVWADGEGYPSRLVRRLADTLEVEHGDSKRLQACIDHYAEHGTLRGVVVTRKALDAMLDAIKKWGKK